MRSIGLLVLMAASLAAAPSAPGIRVPAPARPPASPSLQPPSTAHAPSRTLGGRLKFLFRGAENENPSAVGDDCLYFATVRVRVGAADGTRRRRWILIFRSSE